jgi:hypothetical protein
MHHTYTYIHAYTNHTKSPEATAICTESAVANTHTHIHAHTCMHTCTNHTKSPEATAICKGICPSTHTHTHTHTHIHTHTHTHAHMHRSQNIT